MTGRAVLVTGANRGIGRAVALAFAGAGDRVAVHCRQDAAPSLPGSGHVQVSAELRDPDAVRAMVDRAAQALGGLDVVVNNAGVYRSHTVDSSYEDWQQRWHETLEVNLLGAANLIWCAVRHMKAGGRIVNVSSRGAFRGEPSHLAYGASKAGLNSLTQSLAVALAPRGIAVTGVAPGFVETDMAAPALAAGADAVYAQSPFHRVAQPSEIAAAVLWLASPEAEWASGTIVDLNGASYLRT
jgi:NAD(P)-dependent dehydrogenase (short-subunit alcohol dehydrogenase family)